VAHDENINGFYKYNFFQFFLFGKINKYFLTNNNIMFFLNKTPKKLFKKQIKNIIHDNLLFNEKYNKTILVNADYYNYLLYEYDKPNITCNNILYNNKLFYIHDLSLFTKIDEFNIKHHNPYLKLDFYELLNQIPNDYYDFDNIYLDIKYEDFLNKKINMYVKKN
jgi:hypothetical protein